MIDGGDRDCFGPGDGYRVPWHIFDLLAGGEEGGWDPQYSYEPVVG